MTVELPVAAGVDGEVLVVSSDEQGRLWSPELTEVVGGYAAAEVDHLTWFDAIVDVWDTTVDAWSDPGEMLAETGSWVSYTVADLALGNRASAPECDGPLPGWLRAINVLDERNAPLLACGYADSSDVDEVLRLRLAANRGYSMVVDLPPGSRVAQPATLDLGQAIALALQGVSDGQVVVPATSTVEVEIPRPEGRIDSINLTAATNHWSLAGDAIWAAYRELELPASEQAASLECLVADIGFATAVSDEQLGATVSAVADTTRACLSQVADAVAGGLPPGAKRFLGQLRVAQLTHSAGDALTDWAIDARLVQLFVETDTWGDTSEATSEADRGDGKASGGSLIVKDWGESGPTDEAWGGDDAAGSGCTPGVEELPDGVWFGFVAELGDAVIAFDLACLYTGDAAYAHGADPEGADIMMRNDSPALRTIPIAQEARFFVHEDALRIEPYNRINFSASEVSRLRQHLKQRPPGRPLESWSAHVGTWILIEDGELIELLEFWYGFVS